MLLGYKCEDEDNREVLYEEGKALADKLGIPFFEVSAKKCINVEESLEYFACQIMNKGVEYMTPHLTYKPKTVNETLQFFSKITSKKLGNILFDTSIDDWDIGKCSIKNKLYKKSHILIVAIIFQRIIGCYFPSTINHIGKYCESNKCFVFSLNFQKTYPIKQKQFALCIHNSNDEKLLTIGKDDINIFKKQKKDSSYCSQSSFDYGNFAYVLLGSDYQYKPFTLDRLVIFQMK